MNSTYSLSLLAGSLVFLGATNAFSDEPSPPTPADCEDIHTQEVASCNSDFNHNEDSPSYNNQAALETCLSGANGALISCLEGSWGNPQDYDDFINGIEACLEEYPDPSDSAALESCLLGKLNIYRFKLGLPLIDIDDACGPSTPSAQSVSPIDTIRSAAIEMGVLTGKYAVQVESTLSFQAGISATDGYNMGDHPCIKSAALYASYQTKLGSKTTVYDADTDTSDGVHFDLPIFANRLVDTDDIHIFVVYYGEMGGPVFIEYGTLSIIDSPITGDWNRDQVFNSQDIVDFLDSYDAQIERADINGDDQVTPEDAVEFVDP